MIARMVYNSLMVTDLAVSAFGMTMTMASAPAWVPVAIFGIAAAAVVIYAVGNRTRTHQCLKSVDY